jgi:SAM-dependent methyltransferase
MFYVLKRHPFPVRTHFGHCLVLTYAFPQEILKPLLPPGLALDRYEEHGFVAIALVEAQKLRPSFVPPFLGRDFILSGYRIFTRLGSEGGARRGLYILRSDTNRRLMTVAGNWFTHYKYRLCRAKCEERDRKLSWQITTPNGEADLAVTADLSPEPAPLPASSPFPDLKTARRFAGPLPYTFDYERQTHSIIAIRGVRSEWQPQPVRVQLEMPAYFRREPFCQAQPVLANAFHLQDVPYRWERDQRVLLKAGGGVTRSKYQGMAEILSYNRTFYVTVAAGLLIAAIAALWMPVPLRALAFTGVAAALLWIVVSLAVSHYVYDRSPLYSLNWLTVQPKNWVNVHAGLDQMTPSLRDKLKESRFAVFDIFDPEHMTEPSIQRARELNGGAAGDLKASWKSLPADSGTFDTVFLIFAAHELRNPEARHTFFREVARVLKPDGVAVLVEHLRDFENFLAYGPGCLHFHSRRTWAAAFEAARLRIRSERTITPFVHVFELCRA